MEDNKIPRIECADGGAWLGKRGVPSKSSYHTYLKRQKNRAERRRARRDPECVPAYGLYAGYET